LHFPEFENPSENIKAILEYIVSAKPISENPSENPSEEETAGNLLLESKGFSKLIR